MTKSTISLVASFWLSKSHPPPRQDCGKRCTKEFITFLCFYKNCTLHIIFLRHTLYNKQISKFESLKTILPKYKILYFLSSTNLSELNNAFEDVFCIFNNQL